MSKTLMLTWIEQSLAPHVANAPDGIIRLLFLDSFSVHLMGSVHRAINTGVVQPVDVGYNKPFKGLIRDQYKEWMVKDSEDLSKPLHRVDIACWIAEAEHDMKRSTMVNAWMRHDLEYFLCAIPVIDVPPVVNVQMGEDVTNLISDMEAGSDNDDALAVRCV
jgi:hypothetical protein